MQYPARTGPIANDAAAFSPEMVQGVTSPRPRLPFSTQHPQPISQTTHVSAPLSVEMSAGWHPDSPRLFLGPKIRWPFFDSSLPAASFSIEMVAGWKPDTSRAPIPQLATVVQPVDVPVFSIEMIQGNHPDLPRIFLGPRIPLPIAQTTHTDAPISVEMFAGWHPDMRRIGVSNQTGLPTNPPVVEQFFLEFAGYHPDTSRAFIAPRIPLPLSQTTHVAAAVSVEMFAGYQPATSRAFVPPKQGSVSNDQPSFQSTSFTVVNKQFIGEIQELGIGSILDSSTGLV